MKSDLIKTSTLQMSELEWLKFRLNGLGGSDIATIMGLNKYKSSHQLFYEKVEQTIDMIDNLAMFMGRYMEDKVAELWSYWDGSVESMMDNFKNGNPVRKCRKVNFYVVNPQYPHLFASVDREITKGNVGENGILEVKTISGYVSDQWIGGIPPQYLVQLQQYLLITGYKYGEMAILKDGRFPEVFTFERNETIIQNIIDQSTEFWNKVLQARELYKQKLPFEHLEPEIDNQEAFKEFLTTKFKAEAIKAEPTMGVLKAAKDYMKCNSDINVLEDEKLRLANIIKDHMREADTIDFGAAGKITWKENAKGSRVFKVNVTETEKIAA